MTEKDRRAEWDNFVADEKARSNVFELKPDAKPKESAKEKLVKKFESQLIEAKAPTFTKELRFAKQIGRQWAFDFAFGWPSNLFVAVEIEGLVMRKDPKTGLWQMGGRHGNIAGFEEDCVKYNTAAFLGWTVLRYTGSQVKSGYACAWSLRVLYAKGWRPSK